MLAETAIEGREGIETSGERQLVDPQRWRCFVQRRQHVLKASLVDVAIEALPQHLVEQIGEHGLAKDILLNVNVPNILEDQIKGVQITRLGWRSALAISSVSRSSAVRRCVAVAPDEVARPLARRLILDRRLALLPAT